jgi:hypothetical protein
MSWPLDYGTFHPAQCIHICRMNQVTCPEDVIIYQLYCLHWNPEPVKDSLRTCFEEMQQHLSFGDGFGDCGPQTVSAHGFQGWGFMWEWVILWTASTLQIVSLDFPTCVQYWYCAWEHCRPRNGTTLVSGLQMSRLWIWEPQRRAEELQAATRCFSDPSAAAAAAEILWSGSMQQWAHSCWIFCPGN